MNMTRKTAGAVLGVTLFVGSLIGGGSGLFAQGPDVTPPAVTSESEADQVQEPSYTGSISVDEAQYEGMSEADEAAALQELATISAEEAQAAAEAANPSTTAISVELDDENGSLVYSVELDNGLEVQVDAGDGTILHTEQAGKDDDDAQEPSYTGSITVDEAQYEGMSEADEAAALQELATISAEEAQAAAEAANPGTTAISVELDNENGSLVYSVELDNGLEVQVDAGDGTILHTEQAGDEADDDDGDENEADDDDADDAAESAALQELATISAADAEAAALADYPGATVVETELDRENGQVVYEVALDNGTEVIVDAADGTVLGTEIDD